MNTVQERIEGLLIETERDGILDLIETTRKSGFFNQPCSGAFHLAKEGGLAEHSLNVFCLMEKLRDVLYPGDCLGECGCLRLAPCIFKSAGSLESLDIFPTC